LKNVRPKRRHKTREEEGASESETERVNVVSHERE